MVSGAAMGDFITCGAATPKLLSAASSSHLTPWETPLSVGFVGIDGGCEHCLPFHPTNIIPTILCLTPIKRLNVFYNNYASTL